MENLNYKDLANQCMVRLAEITNSEIAADTFNEDADLAVQFDGNLDVRFSLDEGKGRLYWFIYIGYLPEDTAESNDVCKILLAANGIAQTLTDCSFTLEPDEFDKSLITLVGGVTLGIENTDEFARKLELFLQLAEHWKSAFSEEAATALDASTVKTVSDNMESAFIKA